MRLFTFAVLMFFMCGCVHVESPHRVGDRLELVRDVYLIDHTGNPLSDITVNIKTKSKWVWPNFPVEVSDNNVGKVFLEKKITGILKEGTVLEVVRFDLEYAVCHTYRHVFLRDVASGADFDLSENNIVDMYDTDNGFKYVLSPLVFKSLDAAKESKGK